MHAERETRMQNLRLNACFRKKFLKPIQFLLKMRKGFETEQPVLVVCYSMKFLLLKSVCLLARCFFFDTSIFSFHKHCKIATGIKDEFSVLLSLRVAQPTWRLESSHMT